jgi:FkbM family methyltransferase
MVSMRQWAGQWMLRAPAPLRSFRNAPVIGNWIHRVSHSLLPSDEKVWVQVKAGPAKGIWLRLNPRTGQDYLYGRGEAASQEILAARLRPGDVFYDLGANIGLFSLLASRRVGPTGKVYSFEPDPSVAERLREHCDRNSPGVVSVVNRGVWRHSGLLNFAPASAVSPDHGTGSLVAPTRDAETHGSGPGVIAVPCVSLDDFAATNPPPNAIKCDVEGAEVEVLLGTTNVLRSQRPWVLCETHSEQSDRGVREIFANLGFSIQAVDANHILALPEAAEAR